jgi:hypothetical protein
MSVCLDSWAILAWLDGEQPALTRLTDLIASRPVVSWFNLVEVYYRVERDRLALLDYMTRDIPTTKGREASSMVRHPVSLKA